MGRGTLALLGAAWKFMESRVVVTEAGCWEWQGARDRKGYGKTKIGGRRGIVYVAHRYAWLLEYGDPGKSCVLHDCDNPSCCNPAHLHLGTRQDNNREMRERGRQYELVPKASYQDIIERYQTGETISSIAQVFGVDRTTIGLILKNLGTPKYERPAIHNYSRYARYRCRCDVCLASCRIYAREKRWRAGMQPRSKTLAAHRRDLAIIAKASA